MLLSASYLAILVVCFVGFVRIEAQEPSSTSAELLPRREDAAQKALQASLSSLIGSETVLTGRYKCSVQRSVRESLRSETSTTSTSEDQLGPVADMAFVKPYNGGRDSETLPQRIAASKWNSRWRIVHSFPAYQLNQLIVDSHYSLHLSRQTGAPTYTILTEYFDGLSIHRETRTLWAFDSATNKPLSVHYAVIDPSHGGRIAYETIEYGDHANYGGIPAPTSYQITHISGNKSFLTTMAAQCSRSEGDR